MNPYSSPSTSSLSALRSRAPIHNPYDKFSQPEFDAWIGGITTALRQALDPDDESPLPPTPSHPIRSRLDLSENNDEDEYEEGEADDSFAEVVHRRRAAKGKQRDPAEGPGLYHTHGAREAPIEIFDDEEEEETEEERDFFDEDAMEEHEVNASIMVDEEDDSDHEYYGFHEPLPSRSAPAERVDHITLDSGAKGVWDSDDDRESSASAGSDEGSPQPVAPTILTTHEDELSDTEDSGSGEGINRVSDDDTDRHSSPTSSPVFEDKGVFYVVSDAEDEPEDVIHGSHEVERQDDGVSDIEQGYVSSEEDNDELGNNVDRNNDADSESSDIELIDPPTSFHKPLQHTPSTCVETGNEHRTVFLSEHLPHVFQEVTDALNGTQSLQHSYDTVGFSSPERLSQDESQDEPFPPLHDNQPLQLEDPWLGPKTYAEDFYAGGDFREDELDQDVVSPDKLTALDDVMSSVSTPFLGEITPVPSAPPSPAMKDRTTLEIIDVDEDEDIRPAPAMMPPSLLQEDTSGSSSIESSEESETEEETSQRSSPFFVDEGEHIDQDAEGSSEEEMDAVEYPPLGTSDLDVDVHSFERGETDEEDQLSDESEGVLEEVKATSDTAAVDCVMLEDPITGTVFTSTPPPNELDTKPIPLVTVPKDSYSPVVSPVWEHSLLPPVAEPGGNVVISDPELSPAIAPLDSEDPPKVVEFVEPPTLPEDQTGEDELECVPVATVDEAEHGVTKIVDEAEQGPKEIVDEAGLNPAEIADDSAPTNEPQDIPTARPETPQPPAEDTADAPLVEAPAISEEIQEESATTNTTYDEDVPSAENAMELKPPTITVTVEAPDSDRMKFDNGPITADPSMPDPFDAYFDVFGGSVVTKHTNFSGLFTPADGSGSGNTTPATRPSPDMHPTLRIHTEPPLHRTVSARTMTPIVSPAVRSPLGLHTPSSGLLLRRTTIASPLIADPYPANLSTPGYDHDNNLQDTSDTSYDTSSTSISSSASDGDGSSSPSLPTEHLEELPAPAPSDVLDVVVEPRKVGVDESEQRPVVELETIGTVEKPESPTQLEKDVEGGDEPLAVVAESSLPSPSEHSVEGAAAPQEAFSTVEALLTPIQHSSPEESSLGQESSPSQESPSTLNGQADAEEPNEGEKQKVDGNVSPDLTVTAEAESLRIMSELGAAALSAVAAKHSQAEPSVAPPPPVDAALEVDPFKLMGNDSSVAPGEVPAENSDSSQSATPEVASNSLLDTGTESKDSDVPVSKEETPFGPPEKPVSLAAPAPIKIIIRNISKRKRSSSPSTTSQAQPVTNVASTSQLVPPSQPEFSELGSVYTVAQAQAFPTMLFHAHGRSAGPLRNPLPPLKSRRGESRSSSQTKPTTKPEAVTPITTETVAAEQPKPPEEPVPAKIPSPLPDVGQKPTEEKKSVLVEDAVVLATPPSIQDSGETALNRNQNMLNSTPTPLRNEPLKAKSRRRPPTQHESPVTRSNCRYHKISITRDEDDGPRIHFLVPGCSLGNKKLLQEENIVDLGVAQPEDTQKLIDDIETLDFVPALIAILRQLVGTESLREHEAFYLPMLEDAPVHRVQRPTHPKPLIQPIEKVANPRRTKALPKAKIKRASSSDAPSSRPHPFSNGNANKLSTSLSVPVIQKRAPISAASTSTSTSTRGPAPNSLTPHPFDSESELSEIESSPPPIPPPKKQKQRLMSPTLEEIGKDKPHPFEIGARAISATASPVSLKRVRTTEPSLGDLRTPKKVKLHEPLNGKN